MLDFTKVQISDREAPGLAWARVMEARLVVTATARLDLNHHGQINVPKMAADDLRMKLFHQTYGELLRPLAELQSLVYRDLAPLRLSEAQQLFAEINKLLDEARNGGESHGQEMQKEKRL